MVDRIPEDLQQRTAVAKTNGQSHTFTAADVRRRNVLPPVTHTGNELRSKVFPPVRWAMPEMLAEGVTLFGGREKMGKSWLALGLCIATATGGYALGKVSVERGESLYISLEDNERRLQDRLKTLTSEDTDLGMFHYADEWLRSDEGGTEQLDVFLTGHPDTRLVVVDTLKKIRPYTSGGRNMYDVDYEAIEPFVGLATQHNVAIVIVHHLNQNPDPADPYDAFSGSSGLTAAVEGILLLTRERGQADAYLTVDGKDIRDRQELALNWDANVCTWTIQGDAEQYKLSKERQEIRHVVEMADEPVTPTYVADALGKSYNAVKKTMWEMSRDGQLSSTGNGRYTPVTGNPGNPSNPRKPGVSNPVTEVTEVTDPAGDTSPITCIHGYPAGEGCYLCDPEHPQQKERL
jgi:AAA domain